MMATGTTVPITMQRMRSGEVPLDDGGPIVPDPGNPPTVGIFPVIDFMLEGQTISFPVRRLSGDRNVQVVVQYAWVSQAGDNDFANPTTGAVTLASNETETIVTMETVNRTGTQGDRPVYCTITGVDQGFISSANQTAAIELRDVTSVPTDRWWEDWSRRSGRRWAAGPSYFERSWPQYEDQVAYIDGFGQGNFGGNDDRLRTWDLCIGGPANQPNTILNRSQLDWSGTATGFNVQWNQHVPNKAWCCWVFDLIPYTLRTDTGNRDRAWDEINAGDHDDKYVAVGKRIKKNFQARGVDMKFFLGRGFHEMQQSNYYQIFPSTKVKFASAYSRMIDKMREGAGYNLRFMWAPSRDKIWKGADFGRLDSWFPTGVDTISMSFHPGASVRNRATYMEFINGTNGIYGLESSVAELCARKNIPMSFGEWSPRYSNCVIADDVYNWFFREFLWEHVDDVGIVCDLVFNQTTLSKTAADRYATQTAAGREAWRRGVDVFKGLWKAKGPNWPNYTLPTSKPPAI